MRKARALAALAALVASSTLASNGIAATQEFHSAAPDSIWMTLARSVAPDDELSQSTEKLLKTMVDSFAADKEMAAIETTYPGLLAAFSNALRPLMMQEAAHISPLYQQDLANLYAANFNETEAVEIGEFIHSPQMLRFVAAARQNNSMNAVVRDSMATNDVSAESISSDLRSAGMAASLQIDGADMHFIQSFYATPLGQRLFALNPQKIAIDKKWANYISPEAEGKVEGVVIEAMIAHIAKTAPEVAKEMRKELQAGQSD